MAPRSSSVLLALALFVAACGDENTTVDIPDETTTTQELIEESPLPTVPTTVATTPPFATAAPTTAAVVITRAPVTTRATLRPETSPPPAEAPTTYYANCTEARNAGAAPVRRGDPGYAPHLDRDNDGVGCE